MVGRRDPARGLPRHRSHRGPPRRPPPGPAAPAPAAGPRRVAAWVTSPPAPIGIVAAAVAAAMNPSVAGGNQAAVHIEHAVIAWMSALLGCPPGTGGLLVSGTSAAAITALAVARYAACQQRGWDVRAVGVRGIPAHLLVYATAEGHS